MKNWQNCILIITILILSLAAVNAQPITKTTIEGSYRIAKYVQAANKNGVPASSYYAVSEKAKVDKALSDLKRSNPSYTAKDSVEVVAITSLLYATLSTMECIYKADGTMTLLPPSDKPETTLWEYNEATGNLIITNSKGDKEVLDVVNRQGIIYIVKKAANGSVVEFVKQ